MTLPDIPRLYTALAEVLAVLVYAQAAPPRWVKFPLMAHTTGRPDSPARRSSLSWPRCRGSNSHMMPTASMASPPFLPLFYPIFPLPATTCCNLGPKKVQ